MADEKIIFSMNGVSKILPHNNKVKTIKMQMYEQSSYRHLMLKMCLTKTR